MGMQEIVEEEGPSMPLMALNHVSYVVRSVSRSVKFYEEVLGFVSIKRPSSFSFEGAWLFNYGLGIHLLECSGPAKPPEKKGEINPKDNHISFQCSDVRLVAGKLEAMGVEYVAAAVEEGGVTVDQLFFHDPDGHMVEICNCHVLPVLPLSPSCSLRRPALSGAGEGGDLPGHPDAPVHGGGRLSRDEKLAESRCAAEVEEEMMERLLADIMGISF